MGSCKNRLLHRLAGESSLAFYFLHLLFTYCGTSILFLHPLLNSFSLFQTEELKVANMCLLPWNLVWCLQAMSEEMEWCQQRCRCLEHGGACPAYQPIGSCCLGCSKQNFLRTAAYVIKLYSLCGEEWGEKGTCSVHFYFILFFLMCVSLVFCISYRTILERKGGGQKLCLISVAGFLP